MKNTMMILGLMVQLAFATSSAQAATNTVRVLLPNIVNRVTQCTVNPYSVGHDGIKNFHMLKSHCPEVKVVSNGVAKIRVDSHIFQVNLVESINSDSDLYDVTIRDTVSNDTVVFKNLLIYGDVLLGVLRGDSRHVFTQQVTE